MGDSKAYIVALAAFALTATGVHAYSGAKILQRAGLSEQQVEAFAEAHDLRQAGNIEKARNVLAKAGVTEDTITSIKQAAKAAKIAIHNAIETNDYELFREVVAGSPLSDIVVTEADFAELVLAHEFMRSGNKQDAKIIFAELGVPMPHERPSYHKDSVRHTTYHGLSDEAEEALKVARQANDREAVQAILEEAGVSGGKEHGRW